MKLMPWWKTVKRVVAIGTIVGLLIGPVPRPARAGEGDDREGERRGVQTPIEHVVVIFQENVSFDHYFATYPHADNLPGESVFNAQPNTPKVDNLVTAGLLVPHNPNTVQPFRLTRAQADTCDQNHEYKAEQEAFDAGKMDKFVETVGIGAPGCQDYGCGPGLVMGYYDGSTVTALWNYAQHLRDERPLIQHDVRSVDARRAQPHLRPDARRRARQSRRSVRARHRRRVRRRRSATRLR